jgi:hypothetical protein
LEANGVTVIPHGSPDDSCTSSSIGNRDIVARTAIVEVEVEVEVFDFSGFLGKPGDLGK